MEGNCQRFDRYTLQVTGRLLADRNGRLEPQMSLTLPSTSTCPSRTRCTSTYIPGALMLSLHRWLPVQKRIIKRPNTVSRPLRARLHKIKLTAHTAENTALTQCIVTPCLEVLHCPCSPLTLCPNPSPILTQENKKKFLNASIEVRVGPSHGYHALPPRFCGSVQWSLTFPHSYPSPKRRVLIKPIQLLASILHILLSLHPHVEDRAVATGADDFVVHTALAALALCPQP